MQKYADRFIKLTSVKYVAIYVEPKDAFHVGSNKDIPDSQWGEVAQYFTSRIRKAEKRSLQ